MAAVKKPNSGQFKEANEHSFKKGNKASVGGNKARLTTKVKGRLVDLLEAENYDPFIELIQIGRDARKDLDYTLAFQCAKELASYILPKLKALEVKAAIETKNITHNIQIMEAELAE